MAISVSNQKPAILDPLQLVPFAGDFDPMPVIEKSIIEPLCTPLNSAVPARIVDAQGNDVSASDLLDLLMACLGDTLNPQAEDEMKGVFAQALVYFDKTSALPVQELFSIQAGVKLKQPAPSQMVSYTAKSDVIPAAKGLLAGSLDPDLFFVSLANTYRPGTLGFWFQSEQAFDDFKGWLSMQQQNLQQIGLPPETLNLLQQFQSLTLDGLTESLLLRKSDDDGNDEYSFARVITNLLTQWTQQRQRQGGDEVGILPFNVAELFCPRSLVLVNVDAHAHSSPAAINREWSMIQKSLASPVKIISNKQLAKLTAAQRYAQKMSALAASSKLSSGKPVERSAKLTFRKKPPSKVDILSSLMRVLKRMRAVNKSQNIFRSTKTTYLKANRRDPEDVNKPGRITSTKYLPDLHVYVDTSGSISEANYQDAIMMLIKLAKKLNINLYFHSFSHVLSQETLLKVEGKSTAAIWKEFSRIPKVAGWTDYLQIWEYINASQTRKRRLSVVITDFEWMPPSTHVEHPKNLYYAPCSAMDWARMTKMAEQFTSSMRHIEPAIHQRMLGLYD